jgi:hypothetical protein
LDEFATVENYAELIAVFQDWAKQLGIKNMRAIDIGQNVSRLDDIYDVLGFNPIRINIMNKEIQ